jgi:ABC-type sulfate transport system substrate-binding protein
VRIRDVICSFALLAAAVGSQARAEARNAPADERELTLVMNAWFAAKWEREHPGEGGK